MTLPHALQVFGLQSLGGQTAESLKKIYHKQANLHHPDKGGSADEFIALRNAYTTLKDALSTHSRTSQSHSNTRSQSNSSHSRTNASEVNFQELFQRYEQLYSDYQSLRESYLSQDTMINYLIKAINASSLSINSIVDRYNHTFDELRQNLDISLSSLKKRKERSWWEYVVPVPKLSQEQYTAEYNRLVDEYNTKVNSLNEEYNSKIISTYKQSFEELIRLIKTV